jgi:inhibitor of KinA
MTAPRTAARADRAIFPLGDSAVVVSLGDEIGVEALERVRTVVDLLESAPPEGMIEYVPAFTTVTVIYDPLTVGAEQFTSRLRALLDRKAVRATATEGKLVEVAVSYGGEAGPDLEFVAAHTGLTSDEVITIHCEGEYLVYMIGFSPGFPYLGGMSDRIAAPRRDSPRDKVPAGTVGIAGKQTGIYPTESPGGWQLIGHTALELFRPDESPPSLLRAGDRVRFRAVAPPERSHRGCGPAG